jgi:ABC-2 type transport system ATP-binding protein
VNQFNGFLLAVSSDSMYELLADLRAIKAVHACYAFGDTHHFTLDLSACSKQELDELLKQKGHENLVISQVKATVEDCFMQLVLKK